MNEQERYCVKLSQKLIHWKDWIDEQQSRQKERERNELSYQDGYRLCMFGTLI